MREQIGVTYSPVRGIGGYHMALFYDKGDGSSPRVIVAEPSSRRRSVRMSTPIEGMLACIEIIA